MTESPFDDPVPTSRAPTQTSDLAAPDSTSDGTQTSSGTGAARAQDDPVLEQGSALRLDESERELVVERVLGRGGMGIVYLVHDPRLDRDAAMKLVRDSSNPTRARRFRREAAITAHLDHPGIPPVYETGRTAAGQDYLLLRYVKGKSLAEHLVRLGEKRQHRRQRGEYLPPPRELLEALIKVCDAVAYAHSRGIVHRDLKPDNVMIGEFGEVLLMDWGLARDFRETSDTAFLAKSDPGEPSSDGPLLGTLGYMAPEQARREEIDARADVFGVGAILSELLTGEPPVSGGSPVEVLARTRDGEVTRPLTRNPLVPPELDAIAWHATHPRRSRRYALVEQLRQDLRAYLRGQPVSVYSYRPLERVARWVKRHKTWAVAGALLVVMLLAVLYARGAAHRAQVSAARQEAQRDWAQLRDLHPSDRDAWLSQAWASLSAAQTWHNLAPDDPEASRAVFRAAFALGDAALQARQWALAREAYRQAQGLGVDDARAADAMQRVDAARSEAEADARDALMDLLGRIERGDTGGEREAVLELALEVVRHAGALRGVSELTQRLDAIAADLKTVQHDVLLGAREPDAAELQAGGDELSGLEIVVAVWESEGLTGTLAQGQERELQAARTRLEARARRAGHAESWLEVVSRAEEPHLGAGRLRLATVLCEALGRLGDPIGATPSLARYLWFEAEPRRASVAARALVRLGRPELAEAAVERRFPADGTYARALDHFLKTKRN